jgi:hypothetical protein
VEPLGGVMISVGNKNRNKDNKIPDGLYKIFLWFFSPKGIGHKGILADKSKEPKLTRM